MRQINATPNRDFVIDYDLLNFINDTVKMAIEDLVQEIVDKEFLLMVQGRGFHDRVNAMIEDRLRLLLQEITVTASGAGPGRGHRGRTHKKISLSPEFSARIAMHLIS